MPKKTKHENLYILLSAVFYAAAVAAYFLLPWQWYVKAPVLLAAVAAYEVALYFLVKRFK